MKIDGIAWMEILLSTLKWSAVTGAAVLLLTLLKPLCEKRYSARWRYWAWLALAILALLAPARPERLFPAFGRATAPVTIEVPELELQVSREPGAGLGMSVAIQPVQPVQPIQPVQALSGKSWELADALPVIWLAGIAVFALHKFTANLIFRRKIRRWSRLPDEETVCLYEKAGREMGLKKLPPLKICDFIKSPMLAGIIRPCLLLPDGRWGRRELGFILRHELTHYRRRDLYYKLVLLAANAVHWFNPLAYFMAREAGADMELTCDDAVVALSGAGREARRAYSETLLAAVHREKQGETAFSTHFYGGKNIMKERFRNILGKRGRRWGALLLALTLLATVAAACGVSLKQENQNQPEIEVPGTPDYAGQSSEDYVRELARPYLDGYIALLEQQGLTVADSRTVVSLEGAYGWDFLDETGETVEVWWVDMAAKLENPEAYAPGRAEPETAEGWDTHARTLGADGWLTHLGTGYVVLGLDNPAGENERREYTVLEITPDSSGYAWEDYVCAHILLGMNLSPAAGGWRKLDQEHIDGLLNGHYASWLADWEQTAREYLYGKNILDPGSLPDELQLLYTSTEGGGSYDRSVLASFDSREGTGKILLTQLLVPNTTLTLWQVNGFRWDRDSGSGAAPGDLTASELAAFEKYFNNAERNGLLRFAYDSFRDIGPYLGVLFYDAGEPVTDEAELAAVSELFGGPPETDCTKITEDAARQFFRDNLGTSSTSMFEMLEEYYGVDLESVIGPYLEEYNAYYMVHGDTNMVNYSFDQGERNAYSEIELSYTADVWVWDGQEFDIEFGQPMRVTLVAAGNGEYIEYTVLSNQRVEP